MFVNLFKSIPEVAKEDGVDEILLFIVDILKQESTLLIQNDVIRAIAEKSFNVKVSADIILLAGIVSRKKQIIPKIKL